MIRTTRSHLRRLFEQAPGFMCFLRGHNHVFEGGSSLREACAAATRCLVPPSVGGLGLTGWEDVGGLTCASGTRER